MSTPPSHELFEQAVARRAALDLGLTNALRLIDGEGDGVPGIFLDDFANHWLVSTTEPKIRPDFLKWLTTKLVTIYWKPLDPHERNSPEHISGPFLESAIQVLENGVHYHVSFDSGYSQGLFIDQRDNRRRVRDRCRKDDTVLNTFAYTGSFSVVAALAGATTTTLDLSQPCLDWARDNFRLNGIDPDSQYFIKGDTFHWLRRFAKQGRRFTGIILDPPTFSRDADGKVFRAERDYGRLVELAAACLQTPGWILCTTNCRGIRHAAFQKTIRMAMPVPLARLSSHPMPPDFPGDPYLKTVFAAT